MSTSATAGERFNPFPGLRAFEPDEVHLFFGREAQIDELLGRLRRTRFLSVVGASGSGKSSLVRSGLIPSLHSGFMASAGSSWRIALMRPGGDPMRNLAAALDKPGVLGRETSDDMTRALLQTTLRRSALGLVHAVQQARVPRADNVLIIVDQFEELFRFKQARATADARDEAVAFVKLLLEAARQNDVPIYVVLTMRSEFIGHCTEFPRLAETVNDGQFLVPRMTRDELRLAITGPVAVGGGEIAGRLVTRLLNEVGDDPDQLPILQHALMRTWSQWEARGADGPIDFLDYDAIGTMRNALSLHAEEAYAELADDRDRRLAERLFKALTDMTAQAAGIRRPSRVDELREVCGASHQDLVRVVDRFRLPGRSFLLPAIEVPLDDATIVDLSHESLMRVWKRLIDWTTAEARASEIYRRLSQAADLHTRGEAGLWRDPELQLAVNWRETTQPTEAWARRYGANFDCAMTFLADSQRARDAEIERTELARRHELRRTQRVAVALAGLSLLALVASGFALSQRNTARQAEDLAQQEAARARDARGVAEREAESARREKARAEQQRDLATKANLAAQAAEERATEQAQLATRNEGEARQSELNAQQARANADEARRNAELAADEAKANADEATRRQEEARAAQAAAERARQQEKTAHDAADRLGQLSLARALAGQALREWDAADLYIPALLARQAFLLTKDNDGDPDDPDLYEALATSLGRLKADQSQTFLGHSDAVRAIALNAAGTALTTGADDGMVQLFDTAQPARARSTLRVPVGGVRSLAMAASGRVVAIGSVDGSIHLWDVGRPAAHPTALAAHTGAVSGIVFAGDRLASAGYDGQVRLWNVDGAGAPVVLLANHPHRLLAIAASPDGRTLAAGSDGGGVMTWDLREASRPPAVLTGQPRVSALAFSRDGRLLAAGTPEGRIVYWDLARGAREPVKGTAAQHTSTVTALGFGGALLASASLDRTVKLWRIASGGLNLDQQPLVRHDHKGWVWAAAMTPNGDRVFSASADRSVRSAITSTRPLAEAVCRRVTRNLTAEQWKEYVSESVPYAATCPNHPAAGDAR